MYISSYELEMSGRGNSGKVTLDGVSATDCIKLQQLCHSGNPVKVVREYKAVDDIIPADTFRIATNSVYGLSQCRTVDTSYLREMFGLNEKENKTMTATELCRIEAAAYDRGYERGRRVGFSEGSSTHAGFTWHNPDLKIKKVIFNDPATIVFWADGTKTVAKAHGEDKFDKEVGLTVCIAKKALGNRRHFDAVFKKWIKD